MHAAGNNCYRVGLLRSTKGDPVDHFNQQMTNNFFEDQNELENNIIDLPKCAGILAAYSFRKPN